MSNNRSLVFVVHKHDATTLHFDFRLQIGDVMPSWAIPKGPTLDPAIKRLAIQTTDHSLEYRNFEGVLPEGSYGAGPVMIWDEGYYFPEVEIAKGRRKTVEDSEEGTKIMLEGLKKGEIKFKLFGKRLKGSFTLVRIKNFKRPNTWLLIKHNDEYVVKNFDAHDQKFDKSVVSGRTMEEIRSS
jgi:bifunctional non-homologous end joining protein LigD